MNNREKDTMVQGAFRVREAIKDAIPEKTTYGELALAILDILADIFAKMYPEGSEQKDNACLGAFINAFIALIARKREQQSKTS